jgi:hypothetical protein
VIGPHSFRICAWRKARFISAGVLPADVPPDFGYVTDAAQKQAQDKLAKLVPNAKHITNTSSGHEIHKEQPQLVIDAIREVVDAVRDGSQNRLAEGRQGVSLLRLSVKPLMGCRAGYSGKGGLTPSGTATWKTFSVLPIRV